MNLNDPVAYEQEQARQDRWRDQQLAESRFAEVGTSWGPTWPQVAELQRRIKELEMALEEAQATLERLRNEL